MKYLKILVSSVMLLLLATVALWFLAPHVLKQIPVVKDIPVPAAASLLDSGKSDSESRETVIEHARKHSDPDYVCPMHPDVVSDEPGSCPICGMDLVETENSEPGTDAAAPSVKISTTTAQNMGIRLAKVERTKLSRTINTVGSITYNEDSLLHIHPRASGWVEKVYVRAEGDSVKKGSTLLEFYSPEIVAAQKDLLVARDSTRLYHEGNTTSLTQSAQEKLRLLEVPESLIDQVSNSGKSQDRIPVLSPQAGVITAMGIRDGMYVNPETIMYTIADLSSVWVMVDVFEHQLEWVKKGDRAVMHVNGLPDKSREGRVEYIYPELDPLTRTLKVRLKFDNPGELLKPNMFADITIFSPPKEALSIPAEAVIYYEKGPRVVAVQSDNKFVPMEISTGIKSAGMVEVTDGLEVGDEIVVSGQFMIDSESNLQASFRRMSE